MYSSSGSSNAPLPSWAARADSSTPAWAQTANQPLVNTTNLPAVKKEVKQDLKEIRTAVDGIAKLARKRDGRDTGPQVLNLSDQVRRTARATTAKIRDALSGTPEGSAEHAALAKLSEELKATLRDFQKNVEAASASSQPAPPAAPSNALVVAPLSSVAVDPHDAPGPGALVVAPQQQQQLQIQQQQDTANESQLRAVATNEMVIADREVGIDGIARSVQELHEIFEDINALVVEQGDHIDNIQTNIEKASNHQALAVTELVAASRHQRRSRKCMCWGIIGVMLAVVIFLVVFEIVIKK